MSARPAQSPDVAAIRYIKQEMEAQDRGRSWLADKAGVPYQTLRKYLDNENSALSVGDLTNLLRALKIPVDDAIKEIDRMAVGIDQAQREADPIHPSSLPEAEQF